MIFYVSPRRLLTVLAEMKTILGNRQAAVAREMTKKFEEFIRGTLEEIISRMEKRRVRGEFVLVVEGNNEPAVGEEGLPLPNQIENARRLLKISKMEAIKLVAGLRGRPKSEIYRLLHRPETKGGD